MSGVIEDVFAHRFTLRTADTVELADLGPKGLTAFEVNAGPIAVGLAVKIEGERRPSEIKVSRITAEGRPPVAVEHKKPNHAPGHKHFNGPADVRLVLDILGRAGWLIIGEPKQRSKHFEVLARQGEAEPMELHVDFGGTIYKEKVADMARQSVPA